MRVERINTDTPPRGSAVPLSVLVPTRNEEANIAKCMRSVQWADQLFVVDSLSSDRTAEIAKSHGAEVVPFKWKRGMPRKFNWSMENLPFRNDWLLVLDADEEVSRELADEIQETLATDGDGYSAFIAGYDYVFMGQRLKHGDRLHKVVLLRWREARWESRELPQFANYDLEMHCHPIVRGRTGRLSAPMVHRDIEDLDHYIDRHNQYSRWEAELRTQAHRGSEGAIQGQLRSGSFMERRRWLKNLFLRLPGRPLLFFAYSYLIRGGLLDGRAGRSYAVMKAIYWYEVGLKEREIRELRSQAERRP
jgi:glycosyltransferase involved in cell wall biosynthesis